MKMRSLLFFLLASVLTQAADFSALKLGMGADQVEALAGSPSGRIKTGSREKWMYESGYCLFENGQLSQVLIHQAVTPSVPEKQSATTITLAEFIEAGALAADGSVVLIPEWILDALEKQQAEKEAAEKLAYAETQLQIESVAKKEVPAVNPVKIEAAQDITFKKVHDRAVFPRIFVIGNVHSERNVKRDFDLLLRLIEEGTVRAVFLEGLKARKDGKPYRDSYKRIFAGHEKLIERAKFYNVDIFGSQEKIPYDHGVKAMRGMAMMQVILEYKARVQQLRELESRGIQPEPLTAKAYENKFAETIASYIRELPQYNIQDMDAETLKKVMDRAPAYFMQKREEVAFKYLDKVIDRGYRNIAVIWGKNHVDNFIEHLQQKVCRVMVAQKSDYPVEVEEKLYLPEELLEVVEVHREMTGK